MSSLQSKLGRRAKWRVKHSTVESGIKWRGAKDGTVKIKEQDSAVERKAKHNTAQRRAKENSGTQCTAVERRAKHSAEQKRTSQCTTKWREEQSGSIHYSGEHSRA